MWRFWWYDDGAEDPWKSWYDAQDSAIQAKHDVIFEFLETRRQWAGPHAKSLANGLVEIRLVSKVQHRLIGFYGTGQSEFTVLLPCTHKGKVYSPSDALKTARKRMNEIVAGSKGRKICVRPK